MVLGFNKRFPELILNGIKIHTIREDKNNRWKQGNKIHFATGVRTKNYNQFKEGECISTQHILIYRKSEIVYIDNRALRRSELKELAISDGFNNVEEFWKWFNKNFEGKIIHWTNKKY